MPYTLHRITPDGRERTQGPFERTAEAAKAASLCLYDNGVASKADAQRFGLDLARRSRGEMWTHEPSGYRFRIESAPAD